MNNNITILSERIVDSTIKEYFEEVMNSFYAKSYRSAIVMLYSISICDIVYKLTELNTTYKNKAAGAILTSIEKTQSDNEFSSMWEEQLINECFQKKIIVDIVLKDQIESLRKLRNLCAHPILKEEKSLHKPNRETTLGFIVTIVDELFSKSVLSYAFNDVFDRFSNDLDQRKWDMSFDDINNYVNKAYFDKINNFEVEYKFYKKLWIFVFEKTDTKCEENRMVNTNILELLYSKYVGEINNRMKQDEDQFFLQHTSLSTDTSLKCFIYFANRNNIFNHLSKDLRVVLRNKISSSEYAQIAIFLYDDIRKHYQDIYTTVAGEITHLFDIAELRMNRGFALDFLINLYGKSEYFDDADFFYNKYISCYLNEFSLSQLERLIIVSNDNGQIYGRRKGKDSNTQIGQRMKEINNDFNFTKYNNFLINSNLSTP